MAQATPIPATAQPADSDGITPGSSVFEERADLQLIDLVTGEQPSRQVNYRAVRLLLVCRSHAERLAVIIRVIRQGDFDQVGDAAGLTPARAKELFNSLVQREAHARARIQKLRKIARRDATGKWRRIGKHTPDGNGPIIGRLPSSNLASSRPAGHDGRDDAATVAGQTVGRAHASDRRPGMSDTGDSGAGFSTEQQRN